VQISKEKPTKKARHQNGQRFQKSDGLGHKPKETNAPWQKKKWREFHEGEASKKAQKLYELG